MVTTFSALFEVLCSKSSLVVLSTICIKLFSKMNKTPMLEKSPLTMNVSPTDRQWYTGSDDHPFYRASTDIIEKSSMFMLSRVWLFGQFPPWKQLLVLNLMFLAHLHFWCLIFIVTELALDDQEPELNKKLHDFFTYCEFLVQFHSFV